MHPTAVLAAMMHRSIKWRIRVMAIVWRGLVIDKDMPRSVKDYIREIRELGCPVGADGGKKGPMRGFRLLVPAIEQHEMNPSDVVQRIREAEPDSPRHGATNPSKLCASVEIVPAPCTTPRDRLA